MDRLDKQSEIEPTSATMSIVLRFALIGGIGLPVFFLAAWQLIERAVPIAWNGVMLARLHEFQVMLWPSSLLMLAAPQHYLNVTYLSVALAANVVLYAFIGLLVAKALRSTALLCARWASDSCADFFSFIASGVGTSSVSFSLDLSSP